MCRVLVLCEHASLNGGERSLLAVSERLCESGIELRVAAPGRGPLAAALRGSRTRLIPFDSRLGEPQPTLERRRQALRALLVEQQPQVVHANSLSMGRLSGPVAASLGVRSMAHLRDILRISGAASRDLNRHTRLIAVSQAVREWYVREGLALDKLRVTYNGVDLQRFRPRPRTGFLTRHLRLPPDAKLVLTIGQIILRKGLDLLLESARLVVRQRDDAHFLIVGARYSDKQETVDYESRLRQACTRKPLIGHVHFLGLRDDVELLMAEATLLVHPARQEPLGRVLLEAAAAGVPVVATAVGGTREIFAGETPAACLVAPGQPPAMAQGVLDLLEDTGRRERMAVAARQIAEARFDARAAAKNLADHYREVLDAD